MTHHIDLSSSMKKRKSDAINVVAGKYNPRGLPPRECQCVCLKEFWKQSKITSSHELCPLLHHARHDLYYTRNVLSHILFTPFMVKLLPLWLSVYSLMNNILSKVCNLIGAAHIGAAANMLESPDSCLMPRLIPRVTKLAIPQLYNVPQRIKILMIFMMLWALLRIPGSTLTVNTISYLHSCIPAAQVLYARVTRPSPYAEGLAMPD